MRRAWCQQVASESATLAKGPLAKVAQVAQDGDTTALGCPATLLGGDGQVDAWCHSASGERSNTVLMGESCTGHASLAERLLKRDATVSLQNSMGGTALGQASHDGHRHCVQLLMQASATHAVPEMAEAPLPVSPKVRATVRAHRGCARLVRGTLRGAV